MQLLATANLSLKTRANYSGPRLWIEGAKLFNAGFISGNGYQITNHDDHVEITTAKDAKHRVAGRDRANGKPRPIIDRHDVVWAEIFKGSNGRVAVDFYPNKIIVRNPEN